ncbi:GL24681 [Drosophila persimilis]|uniref:Ras-related protein Rab-26 isoform X2 n=2 Tax=pseudoobscura subgroup TaxID=32358 RepID=A0A0R3P5C1_DROPS|nr:ras-related protein Rab-26 isoform X3 [Drosophila persimilis]XP_015043467.1 ras-related protein Rab-26 isoform X2 [Drosophila pseudoobscura]XP_017139136.1 ras-related protein Rab-26 isoform X2 [Drosophila miranda]EDW33221.1 GL24681 [Drosophila persimilis]
MAATAATGITGTGTATATHHDDASSMSDDVFEDVETTQARIEELRRRPFGDGCYNPPAAPVSISATVAASTSATTTQQQQHHHHHHHQYPHHHQSQQSLTGSSHHYHDDAIMAPVQRTATGYPGYRPSREALQMYAYGTGDDYDDYDDGWRSYRYDEVDMHQAQPTANLQPFDDTVNHKTILLGDSGVGKTSFLVKYNTGEFRLGSFSATVGIALTNKVVVVDGTRVKLQIWDTAGQERFRSVTHAYYRDAHALLLLYDVTNKTTYDNIRAWLGEIREYAQEDVVIVLIGNKADCSGSERQVKREDGERLGREHNVPFMETSAKTGLNVELAFTAVARQLKSRGYEHGDDGKFNVHDFVRDNTKARSVCAQCRNM